jgi:hypothetical protein
MRRAIGLLMLLATPVAARAQGPTDVPGNAATATAAAAGATFSGVDRQLAVRPPRIEAEVTIDGALDEPAWQQASQLVGFSRYAPVDGGAADRATAVLVWYSPTAMHFGVRATALPGTVRATLADRDRIDADDHVQFFLSTFGDGRQAFVFAVNPFGVQMDGALVEGVRNSGGGFGGLTQGREDVDRSPDFVFQSRGRLVDAGFEVEIRIPFKSLRYQSGAEQSWGLHVTRVSPGAGVEDSWAPARREGASFLSQAGRLDGLRDLRRGLVLDITPVATARVDGARNAVGDGWDYRGERPDFGVNVRWGITQTLTLNGTANPDFSQVESDAGQFQFDPRQALFFPDKRPFFLDGIEQFATPNNLIYTRRIVAPLAAAKLTGRVSRGMSVAYLSAVDDPTTSFDGDHHPAINVLRAQQDVGTGSKLAFVYTDRVDGPRSNRVAGVDTRLVWKEVYSLLLQGAASRTDTGTTSTVAPLWQATFNRTGRRYGLRAQARGIDPDFDTQAGFINRRGIAHVNVTNQLSAYGRPGRLVERFTSDVVLDGTWLYDEFVAGRASQDRKLHFNQNLALRGGWRVGASVLVESFGYDQSLYRDHAVATPTADGGVRFVPYTGTPRLPNLDYVLSFAVPNRKGLTADGLILWGKDENFFEWSSADIVFANVGAIWRPTDQLRVEGRYQLQSFQRRTDGSYAGIRRIPRVKVEYQVTRAVFLRVVAEQNRNFVDTLRDDSRTNLPVYVRDAAGIYQPGRRTSTDRVRLDWLFSYQPTPGTVVFAGYGTGLEVPDLRDELRRQYRRTSDGFFAKISYLFRL